VLSALALLVTACENPDFTGVKFKPPKVDPKAFKTAFRAYFFERRHQEPVWGNEFLYHSKSLAEREYAAMAGMLVMLDERVRVKTDANGQVALDGMQEGFHTLRFTHGGSSYATHFRIKREQVSLVVCELRPAGVLASSSTLLPHSFLTVSPFKRLLAFHQGMDRVLGVYEAAAQGRQTDRWARMMSDDYADGSGGKEDFLRAMNLRAGDEQGLKVLGRQGELTEKAAYVVAEVQRQGNPDFVRMELKGTQDGGWRVTAVRE